MLFSFLSRIFYSIAGEGLNIRTNALRSGRDHWSVRTVKWNLHFCVIFQDTNAFHYQTFRIPGDNTAAKMQLVVMPAITKHLRHDSCYINAPKLFESKSQKLNYNNQMLTLHICYVVFFYQPERQIKSCQSKKIQDLLYPTDIADIL